MSIAIASFLAFFIIWRIIYAIMDIWDVRAHPEKENKQPRIVHIKK